MSAAWRSVIPFTELYTFLAQPCFTVPLSRRSQGRNAEVYAVIASDRNDLGRFAIRNANASDAEAIADRFDSVVYAFDDLCTLGAAPSDGTGAKP